jgi:predicted nucleic acid-binding protein
MATLTAILGRTVYLDTNIFIYTVEGYAPEEAFLRELFAALEDGRFTAVTSELSLAEVLVKPFELGREDVVAVYTELLTASDRLAVLPVDRAILVEAARQRAALGMRMPDAIHVATALAAGCELFLTNDGRLRLPSGLAKELLE